MTTKLYEPIPKHIEAARIIANARSRRGDLNCLRAKDWEFMDSMSEQLEDGFRPSPRQWGWLKSIQRKVRTVSLMLATKESADGEVQRS